MPQKVDLSLELIRFPDRVGKVIIDGVVVGAQQIIIPQKFILCFRML